MKLPAKSMMARNAFLFNSGSFLFFRFSFLEFLFQTPNLSPLSENNNYQRQREDWPENTKDPNVDRIVTDTQKRREPKKNVNTSVKKSFYDRISGPHSSLIYSQVIRSFKFLLP